MLVQTNRSPRHRCIAGCWATRYSPIDTPNRSTVVIKRVAQVTQVHIHFVNVTSSRALISQMISSSASKRIYSSTKSVIHLADELFCRLRNLNNCIIFSLTESFSIWLPQNRRRADCKPQDTFKTNPVISFEPRRYSCVTLAAADTREKQVRQTVIVHNTRSHQCDEQDLYGCCKLKADPRRSMQKLEIRAISSPAERLTFHQNYHDTRDQRHLELNTPGILCDGRKPLLVKGLFCLHN